jgi:predicted acylesterase/phospholipase RssA
LTIRDGIEATCAVPLLFQPKAIGDERYIDGAVASGTHADILVGDEHELVVVSAPMSRTGGGWVRNRARRQLRAELASLQRAGCRTIVLIPDDDVMRAAEGYPRRNREARSTIVEAARNQTARVVGQLGTGSSRSVVRPLAG